MKTLQLILSLIAIAFVPLIARCDDKLISVDAANSRITVDQAGVLKVFHIKPFTEITVNGTKASLEQLRPDMTVQLTIGTTQTATKIVAAGLGAPVGSADKPRPFFERPAANDASRRLVVKIHVDGSDRVLYRDGQLWIEHLKAKKADSFTINGTEWKPTWQGDTSDSFTAFNPPLAPIGRSHVTLNQTAGRNKIKLETPVSSRSNATTVLIQDDQNSAETYEFQLTW